MKLLSPVHKLNGSLEKADFSQYNLLSTNSSSQKVGNLVEFIYGEETFKGEVLKGKIVLLVDEIRSVVSTDEGHFVVLNNRFLRPVDDKLSQSSCSKDIDFAKIQKEFADKELAEAEEESHAMWEEAIAQEKPDMNLADKKDMDIEFPFIPSTYQCQIIKGMTSRHQQLGNFDGLKSMIIEALAGCAKSSTMTLIAVFLKHKQYKAAHCRFVAFGKANQQDLQQKIEAATGKPTWGKTVQTLHSFAFEIWRGKSNVKEFDIDDRGRKYEAIAQQLGAISKGKNEGELDRKVNNFPAYCTASDFLELIDKLRIYCLEPTAESILAIAQRCQMEAFLTEDTEKLAKVAHWSDLVLKEGIIASVENKTIDYTDMLWVLWKEQGRFRGAIDKWRAKLKFIGVDESQDLNLLQIEVLKILHNPTTNFFCFVGDRWQSIYHFRGSESDCMDIIKTRFDCDKFDLPLNFRCGTNHLRFVRQLFPHIKIEPHAEAPTGNVRCIKESDLPNLLKQDKIPTFGIARRNASLIKIAVQLTIKGVPVKLKDQAIFQKIFNLVRGAVSSSGSPYNPQTFVQILGQFCLAKIEKLPHANRAIAEGEIKDLEKCCLLLFHHYKINSLGQWEDTLEKFFLNQEADVELHTVHSGKGGEGQRVLVCFPDDMPLTYPGQTDEEKQQERNIIYVALTRCLAKSDLPGSGTMWLVIQEAMEKGKRIYKWPGWLPAEMRKF